MAREELKWQNIDADDLPADVKKSFNAMVEAEATFTADLEKLLKNEGHMPEGKFLVLSRKGKRLGQRIGLHRSLFREAAAKDRNNLSFTKRSGTTRATGSIVRESLPGSVRHPRRCDPLHFPLRGFWTESTNQSRQKSLNLSGDTSVYLIMSWTFLRSRGTIMDIYEVEICRRGRWEQQDARFVAAEDAEEAAYKVTKEHLHSEGERRKGRLRVGRLGNGSPLPKLFYAARGGERSYSRRQLFAKAGIAASRVSA